MNKPIDDKLYLRILQLGRENLTEGLKFNSLISTLEQEGYTINNCTNRSIREWFYNSFFHEEAHCQNGNFNNVQELDNHLNCGFVLKADTCMKLLQFEESEKSNKLIQVLTGQTEIYQNQVELLQGQLKIAESNTKDARNESKTSKCLAYTAIILSLASCISDWLSYNDSTNTEIKDNTTLLLQQETSQTKQLQRTNELFDYLLNQLNSHVPADKTKKENSPKNGKTLNNNLKRNKK